MNPAIALLRGRWRLPRSELTRRLAARWHLGALGCILALSAFLDLYRLGQNGYANSYYAGAVRSMLRSWHNFFFVSFDPGGLVSVDKPPLALWVQAASAKVFGFSGLSLLVPEALAGVAAVALLYALVARYFGRTAGLVAALALAVSPVSVAVNRDNNPDALLALLLVASAYVGIRAVESGRLRTLLATAVLVGLAFNTKMLAAAVVIPGLAVAYLLLSPRPWRVRLAHLGLAAVVLVVVSGAWIAAVDLTPAAHRPYVGSTTDNSALSLAFDYNGLGRVEGQTGGTSLPGGGLGGAFSGTPGPLRLFNDALGDQGGWLLALAIAGGLSAAVAAALGRRRRQLAALAVVGVWFAAAAVVFSFSSGIIHTYYVSALAPATSALVGIGALALARDARRGGWRLALPLVAVALTCAIEVVLVRRAGYLTWLQVPIIAATVAAVAALVVLALKRGGTPRARALLAAGALAIPIAAFLVAPVAWSASTAKAPVNGVFPGAGPSFVSGLGNGARRFGFGGPPGLRRGRLPGFGAPGAPPPGAMNLPPPGAGAIGPRGLRPGGGGVPPGGPGGLGRGGPGAFGSRDIGPALRYAQAHGPGTRFALIVSSAQEAASAVIRGEPVAAMGGFTGRETVLTNAYLAQLVGSHQARYFLLGGGGGFGPMGGRNNAASSTIASTCRRVTASAWSTAASASTGFGSTLYDCAGSAQAIADAGR